ncbi:MAG: hypothetical protein KDD42_02550 [Bdellovibrionales bacterium]|nr:hypothetical protein [Bdellovibrionales bacterium]
MKRRDFLQSIALGAIPLTGCGLLRVDPWHVLIRSDRILTLEDEQRVLNKARLAWTDDGRIRVLFVRGTGYERGYQQGALLRKQIGVNLGYLYRRAVAKFRLEEMFHESYERLRPFIPQEYIDEMHGLAHGSQLPLALIHAIHALPSMTEWGGKRHIKEVLKQMMSGELATSCSNFGVTGNASHDGRLYAVRVLDWGLHRISKLHQYPLLTVNLPEQGIPHLNIGWMGFLGAVSGMNAQQITLGEMGYKNPPNETLRGKPMPFLLRDILMLAENLSDVRKIISGSVPTNSFVYMMTDGKSKESELYIRDADRFEVFKPNTRINDNQIDNPALPDTIYGGHYNDRLYSKLSALSGELTPQLIMEQVIPEIAMASNFQNVIYDPANLSIWVSNAQGENRRAAEQPYTYFDFGAALEWFSSKSS